MACEAPQIRYCGENVDGHPYCQRGECPHCGPHVEQFDCDIRCPLGKRACEHVPPCGTKPGGERLGQEPAGRDPVSDPIHYDYAIKPCDAVDAWSLPHWAAAAVEYIARYQRKNGIEDLRKAAWCINRQIEAEERR